MFFSLTFKVIQIKSNFRKIRKKALFHKLPPITTGLIIAVGKFFDRTIKIEKCLSTGNMNKYTFPW